jgi:hypothetical protein
VRRTVLLDANALMMPFQFRLNLQAELRRLVGDVDLTVPRPVLEELHLLAARDKDAVAALRLAATCRTLEASGSADDVLLEFAARLRAPVVTNDAALLRRLSTSNLPRIYLRSRSHLVAEGL